MIRALILPKAGFTEDALATLEGQRRFGIYAMDRLLIKAVFKAFLPEEIDDNNYLSTDPVIEGRKAQLRNFWAGILRRLTKQMKVDVVLSGNFSYASEQEFAGALSELGIPFVAMHKECLKTPGLERFFEETYRSRKNPFQGHKICVYNDIEKRIQKAAGVATSENILITGMARMDFLHKLREQSDWGNALDRQQPTVLFFSFNTKAGLPIIGRKLPQRFETLERRLEDLSFQKLSRSCHLSMVRLARESPRLKVVIKTKHDTTSHMTLERIFGGNFALPKNLEIVMGGDPLDLLKKSSVVCGFNTTALLEAIVLNKPVIVPAFFEASDPELSPYHLDLEDAAQYADSPERLVKMLRETAMSDTGAGRQIELNEVRRRLLDKWVGNPDGRAGERVREVIESVVKDHRCHACRP
jgi:hypothetical protein